MTQKIKQVLYVLGLLVSGVIGWYLSAYQSQPKPDNDTDFIATVNGQGLKKAWFVEQMKLRGGLKPGQFQTVKQKQALLDVLINEEILFQQAMAAGVGEDSAVNQLYKKTVIDKYITETLNKKIDQVKVGNSEVESKFNQNQEVYNKPARRRGAIIEVKFNESDDEGQKTEKLKRIEKAMAAISDLDEKTTHFGELAKVYSDDRASMYQGGVIGWFINHPSREYKWNQSLIDALFALESPGDFSDIITTDNGYYIVRLVSAEKIKEKSFDQVKKGIKNQLLLAKQRQVKADFLNALVDDAEVSINDNILSSISALSPDLKKQDKVPPALPAMGGAQ